MCAQHKNKCSFSVRNTQTAYTFPNDLTQSTIAEINSKMFLKRIDIREILHFIGANIKKYKMHKNAVIVPKG